MLETKKYDRPWHGFAAARRTHLIFLNKRAQKVYNLNIKLLGSWLIFRRNRTWFLTPGLFFLLMVPVTIAENLFPQNPNTLSSGFPQVSLLEREQRLMLVPCRSVGVTVSSKTSHFFPLQMIADKVEGIKRTINMSFLMLETSGASYWTSKENCCTETVNLPHHNEEESTEKSTSQSRHLLGTLFRRRCVLYLICSPWYTADGPMVHSRTSNHETTAHRKTDKESNC